ncbi:MGMT family protein [Thalassotalea agarivorans]|uniref:Methylated-DNA-protein-cysteine methyltransferase related protein n=1 Tax=Thalassotalea agarivorans TaxID=349064 RepID=A0A1I0FC61_THASX|nr:MGMT family protein [Thalassotalea agarivorans]SET55639.1 methylated-DNA-protein-cysteine methyltransferase related protein [Thalassotalea agarivorans]
MVEKSKAFRIIDVVLRVPKGKVASYGQVADLAGLPGRARFVSRALKQSKHIRPDVSVPWHRIVNAQGKISFATGSDAFELQRQTLLAEGVEVINGRIAMKQYGWVPNLSDIMFDLSY